MKIIRIISLIIVFIGLTHAGNTAFWLLIMDRKISEIPFYIENFTSITLLTYVALNLIIYFSKKTSEQ
jgi:hypothetical protein